MSVSAHRLLALHARAMKLPMPICEHQFHPKRRWRFDLAFLDKKVGIEVDGGVWVGGRHTTGAGFSKDLEKLNAAVELGWVVLRYTPEMVESGMAIKQIARVLEAR